MRHHFNKAQIGSHSNVPVLSVDFDAIRRLEQEQADPGKKIIFDADFEDARELAQQIEQAGMTPGQAYQVITRDLPGSLTTDSESCKSIYVHCTGNLIIKGFHSGNVAFEDYRTFFPDQLNVSCGMMEVFAGQNAGTGRSLMRNQIEFFALLGYKDMTIQASLQNGGYSWARFGFALERLPGGKLGISDKSLKKLQKRIDFLARYDLADMQTVRELTDIVQSPDRYSLNRIAAYRTDIFDNTQSCLANMPDSIMAENGLDTMMHGVQGIRSLINQVAGRGAGLPIGKLLLTGIDWSGYLDFRDSAQMKFVNDYAGGFRYLKFSDNGMNQASGQNTGSPLSPASSAVLELPPP